MGTEDVATGAVKHPVFSFLLALLRTPKTRVVSLLTCSFLLWNPMRWAFVSGAGGALRGILWVTLVLSSAGLLVDLACLGWRVFRRRLRQYFVLVSLTPGEQVMLAHLRNTRYGTVRRPLHRGIAADLSSKSILQRLTPLADADESVQYTVPSFVRLIISVHPSVLGDYARRDSRTVEQVTSRYNQLDRRASRNTI